MRAALRVLAVFVAASVVAGATPRDPAASAAADARATIDAFYAAALQRDWDRAGALLSEDFKIYVDGLEIYDRPQYVALLKADDMATLSLDLRELELSVSHDGRMAWARYRAFIETETKGVRARTRTAETLILERIGTQFKIRHSHVSLASEKAGEP